MSDGDNKEKLITFMVNEWISQKYLENYVRGKELVVTSPEKCYKIYVRNSKISSEVVPALEPTQEEADKRLLFHASHAAVSGYGKVVIQSSDSHIEVISVALQHKIARIYILSKTKQLMRPIIISEINTKLNQEVCDALLGLRAFTGCDSVNAFLEKGKKKPWRSLKNAHKYVKQCKVWEPHGMLMMIY